MKVAIIALNAKYIHSNLAVRYLKHYTKNLNYECVTMEFSINERLEKVLESIILAEADMVGFSCYIWNTDFVKRLAALIKTVRPKTEIFYGGPEVSFNSEEFLLNNAGEYIIAGEGEETYYEFIDAKLSDSLNSTISGLYVKHNGIVTYGGTRPAMDMNKLCFPYDLDENLENKIVYYEASRGCPFNCKFCLSSTIHGVKFLDINRVKNELKFFVDKKISLIKFVDRTFNCREDFAYEIWEYIIDLDTAATFHFEISADLLSEKQLSLLSKAPLGRIQFEIGVQSTNKTILSNINRTASFDNIKEKVLELKQIKNINQHIDLIAGLPGENLASFKKSFDEVYAMKPQQLQLGFLKLLRGSTMREEAPDWGIVYSPFPPYEVLETSDLSFRELLILKRLEEVFDKYYNSGKFKNIINYFEGLYESPFEFFKELGEFYYSKGYYNRSISAADYYKVFLEFRNSKELNEIIKFDYLLYNKKRTMPDFIEREIYDKEFKPLKGQHIEKFSIDIKAFVEEGKIMMNTSYVLFKAPGEYVLC